MNDPKLSESHNSAITCPKCGAQHKYTYIGNIDPWYQECKKAEKIKGWGTVLMPNGAHQVVCKDCKDSTQKALPEVSE